MVMVFLWQDAVAQELQPYFRNIRLDNGLSHNVVNCILEDRRGFLWFGTEDGLNRYDGKFFTVFRSDVNGDFGLSGNIITDLYEDKNGVLWIATAEGGLIKYTYTAPSGKQFRHYMHNVNDGESIPENNVIKIVEDNQGYLWLATSSSFVVRFNKRTGKFDTPVRHGARSILSLALADHDTLWAGDADGGLLRIHTPTLHYTENEPYQRTNADLPNASITALFAARNGQLWFGSWNNKLYNYSTASRQQTIYSHADHPDIPNDEFVSFAQDTQQRLWIAGKGSGVTVYNAATGSFHNFKHDPTKEGSLADDHVNVVYVDRNNLVWVGTQGGISVYNPLFAPFEQHFFPAGQTEVKAHDFYKDEAGDLWIGTSNGIYIKRHNKSGLEHHKLTYKDQSLAVTKFFTDQDNTFYIGTDYTVFIYNKTAHTIAPLPNTDKDPVMKRLVSSKVVSMVRDTLDTHPVLLVSPLGQYITYYDFTEQCWVSRADATREIVKRFNLKDNLIRKIYTDHTGALWLATGKRGLGSWQRPGFPVHYFSYNGEDSSALTSNNVFDIYEDDKHTLWVSTYGGGLQYFNRSTSTFAHIDVSSNLTEGLQADIRGNLWMVCNGHFHTYNPGRAVYSCYDLPNLQRHGGVSGYLYKDRDNTLYAAGSNYYIAFNPADVAPIRHEPPVYLTDFRLFNTSYSHLLHGAKAITLQHFQNFFTLEFSAPEFGGNSLQYAYMLEGVDKDWIDAGRRNYAQYSNLAGGSYRFKVRATNWKGGSPERYTYIDIVITPPFWTQAWFYGLIILFFILLGYLLYRYRLYVLLKQQAIRYGIAQDLHDQIGSTLSSIAVYGEAARIYQEQGNISQLQHVLHTIGETANGMIREMDDIVWAIKPRNDHFGSIVDRINNYARPLCNAQGISFSFQYDNALLKRSFGMHARKNIFLILKEALHNAFKHSACKSLLVGIKLTEAGLSLQVQDDGNGFETSILSNIENSAGNGLSNIHFRAKQLKAELSITSTPGVGTHVRLLCPWTALT